MAKRMREAPRLNPTELHLPDHLQFLQLLWAIVHRMAKRSKWMRSRLGITGPQRIVLRVLGAHSSLSAKQVAATLHVHPSTLTGVLRRLEGQRLIARSSDALDRRKAILSLTRRGEIVVKDERHTVERAVTRALKKVTARDLACTRRTLRLLAESLEQL
jgi:MarR family transcriptional regulator, organic hydroperoxide resistance regulator